MPVGKPIFNTITKTFNSHMNTDIITIITTEIIMMERGKITKYQTTNYKLKTVK